MENRMADAIALKTQPVVLLWADEKPAQATAFKPGGSVCVTWLAAGAAKGKTGACSREAFGSFGGGVGMGFGDQKETFPGRRACFRHFLSSGNQGNGIVHKGLIDVAGRIAHRGDPLPSTGRWTARGRFSETPH